MLVAFDFDGVMCDSTRECFTLALATYYETKTDVESLRKALAQDVDPGMKAHFYRHRKYVRWPREYYFILKNPGKILTQKDFDNFIQTLPPKAQEFEKEFFALRLALQTQLYSEWIDLFDPEPQVLADVRTAFKLYPSCVLTGRDAQSAASFLQKHGISIKEEQIYDAKKYPDKEKGLAALVKDYGIKAREVILLDDNISHLRKLKAHGVTPLWARWGYICDEHLEFAGEVHSVDRNNWLEVVSGFVNLASDFNQRPCSP